MGPHGLNTLKEMFEQAGLPWERKNPARSVQKNAIVVYPKISEEKEAVAFFKISIDYSDRNSTDILNILAGAITMDPTGEVALDGKDVPQSKPLLYPIDIGAEAVKFFDLHYPDSN